MKETETCYMCDASATGREHVPPRCLFPEAKDIPGKDFRKKLITVPSCDVHNFAKSKDDEYLMTVLPVFFLNNPVAKQHINTKVIRSIRRNGASAKALVKGGGVLNDGLAYMEIDSERMFNVCDHIVRGLYFFKYKEKWLSGIKWFSSSVFSPRDMKEARELIEREKEVNGWFSGVKNEPFLGSNPDIFKYREFKVSDRAFTCQLVFYGALRISCVGIINHN